MQIYTKEYAYLLGLYLSDGYINKMPRTYKLRVSLGLIHQDVIDRCKFAMSSVFTNNKVNTVSKGTAKALDVYTHSKSLPELFPQHGSGPKHSRKIELTSWQQDVLAVESKSFVAGLF